MTPLAESLQICRVVAAAVRQWDAVVNQYGGDALAGGKAHLAQRVGRQVSSAENLPWAPVAFGRGWVALVLFVTLGFLPGVGRAVAFVCQDRAAGVGAGLRGFVRQNDQLLIDRLGRRV